jgi:hypothetical protein
MSDFEGLFALFTLMFGLVVAELSLKFADAVDSRNERPIGILTPALAFLLLTDVTSFWLFTWSARRVLTVSWHTVFAGVLLAVLYFMAASLVFPRTNRAWDHLDDHYWSRKRFVAGVMLLVNVVITAALMTRAVPEWNDWWFYFYFSGTVCSLAGLVVSRSRPLDLVFLACAIAVNLLAGSDLTPGSRWGYQVGLSFAAAPVQLVSPQ